MAREIARLYVLITVATDGSIVRCDPQFNTGACRGRRYCAGGYLYYPSVTIDSPRVNRAKVVLDVPLYDSLERHDISAPCNTWLTAPYNFVR